MTKTMTKTIVVLLAILVPLQMIYAFGFGTSRVFGGRITNNKAIEIEALENANYACIVIGSTFTIALPVIGPTSFFVPAARPPRAGQVRSGVQALGTLDGMETITCIYKGYPPVTTSVQLNRTAIWGASAR